MKILLGGGSGYIGCLLANALRTRQHDVTVLSRNPGRNRLTWSELEKRGALPQCDAVVNLSGENILNFFRSWNAGYKNEVRQSRIDRNQTLVELIESSSEKPRIWVSGHAVGYYPTEPAGEEYNENFVHAQPPGLYVERLCYDWEMSAQTQQVRHVAIRTGVVIGCDSPLTKQSYWPFYLGVGGVLGTGLQYFPWIHERDTVRLFVHAIENESVAGVLNAVAPQACTNHEYTKALGRVFNRPTVLPVPEFVINMLAGADRAPMLLKGNKIVPKRTLECGFRFDYTNIDDALKEIYSDK